MSVSTLFLPETGRGTATRSGGVEGHRQNGAPFLVQNILPVPLHHASHGPPPLAGEEQC